MRVFTGEPLVAHPPLYPMVLALTGLVLQTDPLVIVPWLNACLLGLTVYLAGRLAFRVLRTPGVALAATATIALSPALLLVSTYAWSEPLFIVLTVIALAYATDYLITRTPLDLAWLALVVGAACLVRYAGAILLLWGVLPVLVIRGISLQTRIFHVVLFVSIGALPLGLWLLRNYLVAGSLFSERASSVFTLKDNLQHTLETLNAWYLPASLASTMEVTLFSWLGIGLLVGGWIIAAAPVERATALLFLSFVSLYAVWLVCWASLTALDEIGNRLLVPIYVPLAIVSFRAIEALTQTRRLATWPRATSFAVSLGVVLWLQYPLNESIAYARQVRQSGEQYSGDEWRGSQMVAYLLREKSLPEDCTPVSNDPSASYLLAGLTAHQSPAKRKYNSPDVIMPGLEGLRGTWPSAGKACLIWYYRKDDGLFYTPSELHTVADFQVLEEFGDGVVYLATRK